jgi:hypothetical protein
MLKELDDWLYIRMWTIVAMLHTRSN